MCHNPHREHRFLFYMHYWHAYNWRITSTWFKLLGYRLDKQQMMSPLLWWSVENVMLLSGAFCYVTVNFTKVDSSKWCCIVSFSTSNWSISQFISNKRVLEQMAKKERFILHQSVKPMLSVPPHITGSRRSLKPHHWHQTQLYFMKFCISQTPWKDLDSELRHIFLS